MPNLQQNLATHLESAVNGDKYSVTVILATIQPLVVRYCRARLSRLNNRYTTADDVAQEVQIALLTALPRFDNGQNGFLAFVYSIARHKVADAHRRSMRDQSDPWADPPEVPTTRHDPVAWTEHTDLSERLGRLLDTLTTAQREVLVLRVAVGLSSAETAMATGVSPGAVRLTQHRAILRLRSELTRNYYGLVGSTHT